MPTPSRFKRRLIRQAVDDNVRLIQGRLAQRRRRNRHLYNAARASLLLLVPAGLLASNWVLTFASRPEEFINAPPPRVRPRVEPQQRPEASQAVESLRFDRPTTVDLSAFPLKVRKIIIDPGHGGEHPGTISAQGLKEKEVALDIAVRLKTLLAAQGYEVAMTRERDTTIELEDRVAFANAERGDLFLSIHLNWIETLHTRGIETYYLGTTDDPYLRKLARAENSDAGYSLTDFRRLLEGLYVDVRQDESAALATKVQSALYRSLRQVNPELENRGVKSAPFVVLIGTEMPAILAEVACLSNSSEAELMTKPRYRQYIAGALAQGIESYADSLNSPSFEQSARK